VADPAESDQVMAFEVEPDGLIRLSWGHGVRITGELARAAMARVDEINGRTENPLLVSMTGTAELSRDARVVFTRRCSASRIALVGRSAVDRVIANFALGVSSVPVPTRFFTSEPAAVGWLRRTAR